MRLDHEAGLQEGDVILVINGTTIATSNDFQNAMSELYIGQVAALEVYRNGVVLDFYVTVSTRH